ncbi:NHL repeat-containing protein [Streptomyces sp. NPDC005529]|uniref:NHL repeat-containing protein n=1 Tax=unclassified Streptomyces TaxID=2593676 RepID=UPI0033AE2A07
MTTPIPTIPEDVWIQITGRLNVADLNALMSVDKDLHHRLRTNPRTWQTHLNACTDTQLTQIADTVPALKKPVQLLLELRAMTTIAGTGQPDFSGDSGPAQHAALHFPEGVAVASDGTVYIADTFNHRIRRIGADGIITTLAGTGRNGVAGDDGPAHQATLSAPFGVAVAPDGTVYIADTFNHRIRRIGADGIITTLAGTGQYGYGGDGGPAHQALLRFPEGVAAGSDGTVYIADTSNHRIRRIGADGIITTLAGTGQPDSTGDGGPAHQATLSDPRSVAVNGDGTVYIADTSNHRIRRIGTDNVITTLAGTGRNGFGGDGGPAHQARLATPRSVAVGPGGTVYVADMLNHRIRRIGADNVITTLAGTGRPDSTGDGGSAHQATFSSPHGVAVSPDGLVHVIADSRLRRFGTPH